MRSSTGLDALFAKIFAPWSVMPPRQQWAETIRRMPGEHGTTRPFSFGYAPYQLEPLPGNLQPAQPRGRFHVGLAHGGKSEVVQNVLGRTIHQTPCRIGVMWPVEGDGKLWSKDDFMGSLVEPTPRAGGADRRQHRPAQKRRTRSCTKFSGRPDPHPRGQRARSTCAGIKARVLYGEEIDAIVRSSGRGRRSSPSSPSAAASTRTPSRSIAPTPRSRALAHRGEAAPERPAGVDLHLPEMRRRVRDAPHGSLAVRGQVSALQAALRRPQPAPGAAGVSALQRRSTTTWRATA